VTVDVYGVGATLADLGHRFDFLLAEDPARRSGTAAEMLTLAEEILAGPGCYARS
jgi:hypothetical protein